jgi:hypothetical protein
MEHVQCSAFSVRHYSWHVHSRSSCDLFAFSVLRVQ